MRQQLLDLNEIQKIDLEIREIETGRQQFQERISSLGASVEEIRKKVDELTQQRELNITETKTLEGTVQAESIKLRKWEARLNDIRNQREYLALSREVEGTKRANRELEEKILELMTAREAVEKELDELQDRLAEEEVDYASEKAEIERSMQEAEEHLVAETKRRDALLDRVPKSLLRKYDRIRKARLGIGLVPVVDGFCKGCNMRLPPQLYNILQRGDSIEQCPSCHRIVFWQEFLSDENSEADAKEGAEATP